MGSIEFYMFEDELWCMSPNGNQKVSENDTELIKTILERVRECYPKAYEALQKNYEKSSSNVPYYQFLMANRFCRCNFGELDSSKKDIDNKGIFNFERVKCPLRGECKHEGVICCPKFNSKLSEAEMRVMKLIYEEYGVDDVADALYLSPNTVKNHIKSVYTKLGIHKNSEFINYANKNNLFKEQ